MGCPSHCQTPEVARKNLQLLLRALLHANVIFLASQQRGPECTVSWRCFAIGVCGFVDSGSELCARLRGRTATWRSKKGSEQVFQEAPGFLCNLVRKSPQNVEKSARFPRRRKECRMLSSALVVMVLSRYRVEKMPRNVPDQFQAVFRCLKIQSLRSPGFRNRKPGFFINCHPPPLPSRPPKTLFKIPKDPPLVLASLGGRDGGFWGGVPGGNL